MAGDPAAVLQQLHGQVSSWDAVQDELLLRALQSLRDGILRRAEITEERLQKTARRAEAVGLKLRMASCSLEVLAQSQFLEHRVETEEDTVLEASAEAVEDIWSNLDVETAPEAEIEAIRQAFSLGQDFVHMKVDEDWPALPLVLGSEAWHSSWDAPQSVADFLAEDPPSPPRFEEPQPQPQPQAEAAQEDAEHAEQAEQAEQEEHEALESSHHDDALPKPVAEEAPDLVSSLNALFARRGGPLEGEDAGGPVGAGGPPLPVPGPKAKAKGKGKGKPGGKPSSRPTDSLFDDSGSLPVPSSQAAQTSPAKSGTSSLFDEPEMPAPVAAPAKPADPKALSLKPMASLFDDEPAPPAQKASPAKSGASSLFDDDAPSPPAKAPLTLKAGTSSLFDDETASGAPQPKAPLTLKSGMASLFDDDEPAKRPAAKTKVAPSPKKAPGPSLFSEQPPAKVAEHAEPASAKAKAVPKSAASLFDDVPLPVPASKSRAVTAKAPVPRAHDPLFDDEVAPKAASRAGALGPLGTSSGQPPPALPKSGGGIFDDAQASTTVPKKPKAASLLFDDSDPSATRSSGDPPQVSGKGVGLLAAVTEPLPRKALPETADSEPPKAPAKLPKAVESLFEEPSSDNAVGSAAMPPPAASRAKARPAAEASLFGDEPQGGAGTTSLFGNKPPPTPIRPGPSAASAVAALFDAPTSPIATTATAATAATPAPSSTTLAAAQPSQSPESAGAGAERPSLFGGARSVMASIFDDDGKTSATSFLAAKPASGHPAGAGEPVESVTPGAPMAEGSGTAQTFTAEAVEPTVSKAAPETSVKSTAAGRLAALRQRISSGSSGSDSDAAWEPEPTKPAASTKSTSLFGAPPAVSDPFEKPSEAPGPGGFPASAAPRKDSEREFPAPAKEDVKEERVEPVEKAAMSLPEPTPGLSAERASGIESERPEPSERPSLFGGTKGPSGRTMNSIFDDDDDDDFIKPGPLAKAGLGASSGPPRSSLSSLFGEPGPAGPPGPSPGPPLPVPSKAPPTSASSLADPLRASQGTLKAVQQKAEEKDQDVQSPPNKVDPLGGLRMKPPL